MDAVIYQDGALGRWCVSKAVCLVCTNQWIAVHPETATEIECPSCESTLTEPDDE